MTKQELHEAIDSLGTDELAQLQVVLEQLSRVDPRDRWRNIPGLKVPDVWPPDYGQFQPLNLGADPLNGGSDSVAERLIRERR